MKRKEIKVGNIYKYYDRTWPKEFGDRTQLLCGFNIKPRKINNEEYTSVFFLVDKSSPFNKKYFIALECFSRRKVVFLKIVRSNLSFEDQEIYNKMKAFYRT